MANLLTPTFRVSYPHLFKPQLNELSGKMEYSVVALFTKGQDLSELKKLAQKAIEGKWGADRTKWPVNLKSPFRDQGERAKNVDGRLVLPDGYEEGAIFLTFKSAQKPGVVDQSVQDIIDEAQMYAGCYARASVNAYPYDNKGNRGVAFGLANIQKVKDGDSLSGRTKAQEDFAPIVTEDGGGSAPSDALSLFS